tara:strand:- start:365 stop:1225 length:861 start_codon:yes stop_codon:yes gene_type:complete
MELGAVFPHNEIGDNPKDLKDYAQGLESLGVNHLLIYDHVLGADPNRPGGWSAPYDKDTAFHEPLTTLSFLAAVTDNLEFITTILILPQRQTVLAAKQAAQLAILSKNRFRMGIGTGWNEIEYEGLNENFRNRGKRQAEQVDLMRTLWESDSVTYKGQFHTIDKASINPRPSLPIPIWFGGSAPALLERCAILGDGWIPLMGANEAAEKCINTLKKHRQAAELSWESFGIQAQAQFAGGNAQRWKSHAEKWKKMGCTHLAVATHNAEETNIKGHLNRVEEYLKAVG